MKKMKKIKVAIAMHVTLLLPPVKRYITYVPIIIVRIIVFIMQVRPIPFLEQYIIMPQSIFRLSVWIK